jgi:DNA-binding NarL/FixJ family response regulator
MEETILVIGDHEDVRSTLRERLEIAFAPYQVIEAAGSEEAVTAVLSLSPHLVVIDIGPPATEQLEVVRRIKTIQPSMQIVVWTIHDWQDYRADALAAGATAYVLKEETPEKLLSALTIILAARPVSPHSQTDK